MVHVRGAIAWRAVDYGWVRACAHFVGVIGVVLSQLAPPIHRQVTEIFPHLAYERPLGARM